MSELICPECGKNLTVKQSSGSVVHQCWNCGYSRNATTGLVTHFDPKGRGCVVVCGNCGAKNRAIGVQCGEVTTCAACGAEIRIPERPDPDLKSIVPCPHCSGKNRVTANQGNIKVTCGHCGKPFMYDSGIWPTERANPSRQQAADNTARRQNASAGSTGTNYQQRANSGSSGNNQSSPQNSANSRTGTAPCRTLVLERLTHAYKNWDYAGIKNRFMDNYPVHVFLDDQEQGLLPKDDVMTLKLDANAHGIKSAVFASQYSIPAGKEDYVGYFFNGGFQLGPVEDPFRDQLVAVVLRMFRGQGIRDRIMDSNNRNRNVELHLEQDCIRISWQVANTRGLKQWATGEDEERISYRQAGLCPPAAEKQPGGYWTFLKTWVERAILEDEEADMERYMGGFTFCSHHKLF